MLEECYHESFCVSFFFFSSRRRHTRYWRDWSSDVCSSDLERLPLRRARRDRRSAYREPAALEVDVVDAVSVEEPPGGDVGIGRGWWRGRGEISGVAVSLKKKTESCPRPASSLSTTDP